MWWIYVLLGIYALACVVLITAVLLQPGKADAAALFGGGASQTAFGPRGAQNVLGWTTWIAAALVIVLALILSLPIAFGPQSVIRGGEAVPIQQPATSTPESNQPAAPTGEAESKSSGSTQPEQPASSPPSQ